MLFIDVLFKDLKYLLCIVTSFHVNDGQSCIHAGFAYLLVLVKTALYDEEVEDLLE